MALALHQSGPAHDFPRPWHGDIHGLKAWIDQERARYNDAAAEDFATPVVIGGEVADPDHLSQAGR